MLQIQRRARRSEQARAPGQRAAYRSRDSEPTTLAMQRRLAVNEVLDKHRVTCPRCRCPEAVVLIDAQFEVNWQCVDCDTRWPASDEESALLLGPALKTIH
jgi:hypothetical protein